MGNQFCKIALKMIHQNLVDRDELKNIVEFTQYNENNIAFKAKLKSPFNVECREEFDFHKNNMKLLTHISITYPSDVEENCGPHPASIIETILFSDSQIIYCNEMGYSDICRFNHVDEVVDEIIRIANFNKDFQ